MGMWDTGWNKKIYDNVTAQKNTALDPLKSGGWDAFFANAPKSTAWSGDVSNLFGSGQQFFNPLGTAVNYNADQLKSLSSGGVPLRIGESSDWLYKGNVYSPGAGSMDIFNALSPEQKAAVAQQVTGAGAGTWKEQNFINAAPTPVSGGDLSYTPPTASGQTFRAQPVSFAKMGTGAPANQTGTRAGATNVQELSQQPGAANPTAGGGAAATPATYTGASPATGVGTFGPQAPGYGKTVYGTATGNATIDPGYQWRLDQGMNALERSAAGRGTLNSGGTLKDLTTYAQGQASQEYQAAVQRAMQQMAFDSGIDQNDRQFDFNAAVSDRNFNGDMDKFLAQLGYNSSNDQSRNDIALATAIAQLMQASGQAQGSGTIGQGNNISQVISNLLTILGKGS